MYRRFRLPFFGPRPFATASRVSGWRPIPAGSSGAIRQARRHEFSVRTTEYGVAIPGTRLYGRATVLYRPCIHARRLPSDRCRPQFRTVSPKCADRRIRRFFAETGKYDARIRELAGTFIDGQDRPEKNEVPRRNDRIIILSTSVLRMKNRSPAR